MKNVSGKTVRRLYLNQIVISVFGVIVITAASFMGNAVIFLASFLAVGLYLFLVYDAMWNAGAKDAAKRLSAADAQVEKVKTPFYTVLFASAVNIINAVIYAILWNVIYADDLREGGVALIGDAMHQIIGFANGMYIGFERMIFPHPHVGLTVDQSNEMFAVYGSPPITELTAPWFYFLIPAPLFIAGIGAYYIGASEMKLRDIFNKYSV